MDDHRSTGVIGTYETSKSSYISREIYKNVYRQFQRRIRREIRLSTDKWKIETRRNVNPDCKTRLFQYLP